MTVQSLIDALERCPRHALVYFPSGDTGDVPHLVGGVDGQIGQPQEAPPAVVEVWLYRGGTEAPDAPSYPELDPQHYPQLQDKVLLRDLVAMYGEIDALPAGPFIHTFPEEIANDIDILTKSTEDYIDFYGQHWQDGAQPEIIAINQKYRRLRGLI